MLEIYAVTALILAASLVLGRAVLALVRWPAPAWSAGAVGFAALVVAAPLLIRLPGRAATAAVVIAVLVAAAALVLWRRREPFTGLAWPLGVAVAGIALALATLPFVFNERVGVLGEGIYTNDHAAQLFWAEWLKTGFGPEPSAVSFGYPVGPQALVAVASEATGIDLVAAFNGLALAIPVLTALTALSLLERMPPLRRIAIAALTGLPYLAASFLAQTAFKETAMAMLVLAFVATFAAFGRIGWRGLTIVGLILAAAAVFTFSIPGLAWFAIATMLWFAAETVAGRSPVDWRALGDSLRRHRLIVAAVALVVLAGAALAAGPAINFVERINDVGDSVGRLSSPVFWGEVFGIWPEGDFRIVRGSVPGALVAAAVGLLAASVGAWYAIRRREWPLVAMLVGAGIVYVGARLFTEIHVEAKALAIAAPLVMLTALRGLLAPREESESRGLGTARLAFGGLFALAALASTLLALRAAPVGYDDRSAGLERLAEEIDGESVAFLGLNRFAGYRLRGTLARAPAGYVPEEIAARPEKPWRQGQAVDFDTLEPGKLDKFEYAITTAAAYASAAPQNFEPVLEAGDYVLWERNGETPRSRILGTPDAPAETGAPGAEATCEPGDRRRAGVASVFETVPKLVDRSGYRRPPRVDRAIGGQEDAFVAPATATAELELEEPGPYELSLQYHSQVPLEVIADGETVAELPPSLDGMYFDGAGHGSFWPAGELDSPGEGPVEVEIRAAAPSGFQDALGVERRVWLGTLAATSAADPVNLRFDELCDMYVDHFRFFKGGGGG